MEQGRKTIGNSELFSLNLGQIRALLKDSQNTAKTIRFSGRLGYSNTLPEPVFYAIADPALVFEKLECLKLVDMERLGIANSKWLNGARTIIENSPVLKELVLDCQHDFNEDLTKHDGFLCKLSDSIEKMHLSSVATGKTFELLTVNCSNLKSLNVRCRLFSQDYEAITNFFRTALGLQVLILKVETELDVDAATYEKRRRTSADEQPCQLMPLLKNFGNFWQPHALGSLGLESGHCADPTYCAIISKNLPSLRNINISAASVVDVAIMAFNLAHLKAFELSMESWKRLSEIAEEVLLRSDLRVTRHLGKTVAIEIQRPHPWLFKCSTTICDTTPALPVVEFIIQFYAFSVGNCETATNGTAARTDIMWPGQNCTVLYDDLYSAITQGGSIVPWFHALV